MRREIGRRAADPIRGAATALGEQVPQWAAPVCDRVEQGQEPRPVAEAQALRPQSQWALGSRPRSAHSIANAMVAPAEMVSSPS